MNHHCSYCRNGQPSCLCNTCAKDNACTVACWPQCPIRECDGYQKESVPEAATPGTQNKKTLTKTSVPQTGKKINRGAEKKRGKKPA